MVVKKINEGRPFICVAGKNSIAVEILEYLLNKNGEYELGIVCNKTETGKNSFQKSLRWFANKYGVKEYSLEDLYNIENLIFLSMEFDSIVKPNNFNSARLYNIHFSLLPKYKGMYTSVFPILNGEKESGVTLHRIDSGIDTGEIIDQKVFSIEGMDCREVYLSYIEHGIDIVLKNIDTILEGKDVSKPQLVDNSSYYSKNSINYKCLRLDLNQTAEGIARQIRAYSFREYQMPIVNGHQIIDFRFTKNRSMSKPGTVLCETENACILSSIDYNIILYYDKLDELLDACREGNINKVQKICSVNKHVNSIDRRGQSPLMVATQNNQYAIVQSLLVMGADVNVINYDGVNLMGYAIKAGVEYGDWKLYCLYKKMCLNINDCDYYDHRMKDYIGENEFMLLPNKIKKSILGEDC